MVGFLMPLHWKMGAPFGLSISNVKGELDTYHLQML